ncbi:MAG TPA: hypothetical protein VNL16_11450, partial [Chloroflexota bacterium]|nr:hypothetical protein [Chloroflexota bacterium]
MPSVDDLWFVVGYDKIVQIFDHRYYEDRDAALDRLFTLASFLVSPRAPHRPEDLDTFLTRSANRRYADRVLPLALPTEFQRLSSTRVRAAAALTGPSTQDVPAIVGRFIQETGAYAGPTRDLAGEDVDGYAIRERLIDAAERGGLPALSAAAFRAAIDRLIQPDDDGRRRRAALRRGDVLVATEERLEQTP